MRVSAPNKIKRGPTISTWLCAVIILLLLAFAVQDIAALEAQNPIEQENQREGTSDWLITNPANNLEVAGYAHQTSINQGESLDLFISSNDQALSITVYRLGWYDGLGAREIAGPITISGLTQPIPSPQSTTGLLDLNWQKSSTIETGADWVTGSYLIKLKNVNNGKQSYIPFTLRDDDRPAEIVFQHSVTTWQAYNNFGGKSLYSFNSSNNQQANVISFNRPYTSDFGSGELLRWEYPMIRWLEREGYDVTYITNLDTHRSAENLKQHQAFLSVGHDEYWSWEMRDHVEALRSSGVNLGFFSANSAFWQIRFEPSQQSNSPDRIMVGYRYDATSQDPILNDGNPSNDHLTTGLFRAHPSNRPEEPLIGVMYGLFPVDNEDMIVENTGHWVFEGTGLQDGDVIPNVMGYEVDGIYGFGPNNLEILASTPLEHPSNPSRNLTSHMTIYETGFDSYVFATGTIQWSWGLDNFVKPYSSSRNFENDAAKKITKNVLDRFVENAPSPTPTVEPSHTPTATATETLVPTAIATETLIPTVTATETLVPTAIATETLIPTVTATETLVPTAIATETLIPTVTATETLVPTAIATATVPSSSCGPLVQEAEDGTIFGSAFVVDNRSDASGGQYIHVPDGFGHNYSGVSSSNNFVAYCFNITADGDYKIEGFISYDGSEFLSDSFFVQVDDAPTNGYLWDTAKSSSFIADDVNDRGKQNPVVVSLAAGEHIIKVHLREDGTLLDKISLVYIGEPSNPLPTAEATQTLVPTATATETLIPTATATETLVPTAIATETLIPTVEATETLIPTATATETLIPTVEATETLVPTVTATETLIPTAVATETLIPTAVATVPSNSCGPLVQEAEDGTISGSAFVVDNRSDASGGQYIHVPDGSGHNYNGVSSSNNYVAYCFNVTADGDYKIEGFVSYDGSDFLSDSFFIQVDDSPTNGYLWDTAKNSSFIADDVSDRGKQNPVVVSLAAGEHILKVHLREDGTLLDTISLVYIGEPSNPLPTAEATQTLVPTAAATETLIPTATATETLIPTAAATETLVPTAEATETLIPTVTATETLVPTPTATATVPASSCGPLVQEAEDGTIFGSAFVVDNRSDASGEQYLHVPDGFGHNYSGVSSSNNYVAYCFNVTAAGNYKIEGSVSYDGSSFLSDSFFIQVDDSPTNGYLWDTAKASSFISDDVNDRGKQNPVIISLTAGEHIIKVHLREDGTLLDTISLIYVGGP